ncbi:hypothetical protein L596_024312 [Steinernema carpocapsae]|uniref:Uncharacterized protein n=1 Tax=Steinernema carpocapsae TaxID=34508 RepID=A0A4V5ZZQ1_STECR|nr:hypothetical protein L596_024312 [Steinernema carpocapsae]
MKTRIHFQTAERQGMRLRKGISTSEGVPDDWNRTIGTSDGWNIGRLEHRTVGTSDGWNIVKIQNNACTSQLILIVTEQFSERIANSRSRITL